MDFKLKGVYLYWTMESWKVLKQG